MLVGLSRTAVSATLALLFLLTAIIPLVYCIPVSYTHLTLPTIYSV